MIAPAPVPVRRSGPGSSGEPAGHRRRPSPSRSSRTTRAGLGQAERSRIEQLALISPDALAAGGPDRWHVEQYLYRGSFDFDQTQRAFLPGLLILFIGGWCLRSPRAGDVAAGPGFPAQPSRSPRPFLVAPLAAIGSAIALVLGGLITIAGDDPARARLRRPGRRDDRTSVDPCAGSVAGLAAAAGIAVVGCFGRRAPRGGRDPRRGPDRRDRPRARPDRGGPDRPRRGFGRAPAAAPGGLLQSTELALAGATPILVAATVGLTRSARRSSGRSCSG